MADLSMAARTAVAKPEVTPFTWRAVTGKNVITRWRASWMYLINNLMVVNKYDCKLILHGGSSVVEL